MSNEPFYKWKALKCIHIVPGISLRGFVKSKKEKPPKIFQQCNEEMLFAKCCLAFRDANQDKLHFYATFEHQNFFSLFFFCTKISCLTSILIGVAIKRMSNWPSTPVSISVLGQIFLQINPEAPSQKFPLKNIFPLLIIVASSSPTSRLGPGDMSIIPPLQLLFTKI